MAYKGKGKDGYDRLISFLRNDDTQRINTPDINYGNIEPVYKEDYKLLVEHWRYLREKTKKEEKMEEKEKLQNRVFQVQQYMLVAQFGDRNTGRFNQQ